MRPRISLSSLSRSSRNLLKPPPHSPYVGFLYVPEFRARQRTAGDEHDIRRDLPDGYVTAIDLAEKSLRTVALDRPPDAPTRDDRHSESTGPGLEHERDEERTDQSPSLLIHHVEIPLSPQNLDPPHRGWTTRLRTRQKQRSRVTR
jgi:hypothetical protein